MTFDYYPSPFEHQSRLASLRFPLGKRKREQEEDESEESDEPALGIAVDNPPDTNQHGNASFASELNLQGEPFPKGFPHRAIGKPSSSKPALTPKRIQHELLQLRPPLYLSGLSANEGAQSSSSLKQSVIASLTMIMHRCLLQGDFSRASRAFGMLLRSEVGGEQPDLRRQKFWGIGAEILLRQNEANPTETAMMQEVTSSDPQRPSQKTRPGNISSSSFQLAKEYYDRLILEYNYQKRHSHNLSSLHFHPLMFSLWIFFVYNEHLLSQSANTSTTHENDSSDSDPVEALPEFSEHDRRLADIRTIGLEKAQQIIERMEEVMDAFPYSEDATLWRLKGDLHLWMSDLLRPSNKDSWPDDSAILSPTVQTRSMDPTYSTTNKLDGWREHSQKAIAAFEKARECLKDSLGSGPETHESGDGHT